VHLFRPSLSFWPRRSRGLKKGEDKRHFLVFLDDRTNYKAKNIIGKITNLFRTGQLYIDFVGFVANLLNRPTDGGAGVRKRVTFRPLVST
jgi:hypothetical protein